MHVELLSLFNDFFYVLFYLQQSKSGAQSEPISVKLCDLEDFYMTDSISRASQTMAKCVSAVRADRENNK